MINTKWWVLTSPNASLVQKAIALSQPTFYIADNVADFLENARYLPRPFYKRDSFLTICIYNVYISRIKGESRDPRFLLYDESGQDSMGWLSYDTYWREAGIKEEDFVNVLYFMYRTREERSEIIAAFKAPFNHRGKKKRETSLGDRLKEALFSGLSPEPIRAF